MEFPNITLTLEKTLTVTPIYTSNIYNTLIIDDESFEMMNALSKNT